MKPHAIAALGALVLTLVVAGPAGASGAAVHTTTVRVKATDFKFTLSTKSVKHGRITFVLKNASSADHNFAIAGRTSRTIGAGKTTRLTVTLKRGRYPYRCTVDSHAELGMKGVLKVT
jgi:plastocyanin